ncbi:MAG: 1-acyl-sn-glycerol-3-phosphate acyltransferase [Chloroflexaceae bacterium]|nr:1-acyl-sn-glycerol-3-phosphate acyltransferase [Chloroflexaceae bacterium]
MAQRHNSCQIERGLRYLLPGRRIALDNQTDYLRTLIGLMIWVLGPPYLARLLGRRKAHKTVSWLQHWWSRSLGAYLGLQLDITGLQHIQPGQTYIITPLHEGLVDALVILHLPLPMRFVVRDEFLNWRLLGPYLRDTDQIVICPERGREGFRQVVKQAQPLLAVGQSLVIFPQGSILGIEIDCMSGAFALARRLQQPVLPVALTGSHRVWEHPYSPRLRYGQRVSLRILQPIAVTTYQTYTTDDLRQLVQQRLKTAAVDGSMVAPRRFVPSRDGYWDAYAYRIDPQFACLAAQVAQHRANRTSGTSIDLG